MRQIVRLLSRYLTLAAVLTLVSSAHAQRAASDKAAAESLFDQALELMKEKRYSEACPKLEESQRIDAGIGTLLYLAECYEKSGRTASAWATFREAASAAAAAGQAERARQGKERADRLEGSLSKLNIQVAPQNQSIEQLEVTRAGRRVQPALFDTSVPVDPGELLIEATAPGYESYSAKVTVPNGSNAVIRIPPLVAKTETTAGSAPPGPGASDTASMPSSTTPALANDSLATDTGTDAGSTMRTAGVVLMGVGAAGLVVGSVFGLRAINKDNEADDYCDANACSEEAGETLSDEAQDAALISTISFAAGGVAALAGAVLYVVAPDLAPASKVQVRPVAGGAALSYQGRF